MPKKKLALGGFKKRKPPAKGGRSKTAPSLDKITGPLTGKRYRKEEKAAERKEFAPLQRQLNREEAASAFRERVELPSWYNAYQNDIARLQGGVQGVANQGQANVAALAQQGGQQDAANQAAIMQRLQQDAQFRGTTVDPDVDISQAGAQGARQNLLLALQGTLAGQSANQAGYMGNLGAIARMGEGEARGREFSRRQGIQEDQRELAKKRGEFRTLFRRDTREDERKHLLELKALGLDKFEAKSGLGIDKAKLNLDKAKFGEDRRKNLTDEELERLKERGRNRRSKREAKSEGKGKKKGKL